MLTPILIVGAGPTGLLAAIWLKTLAPEIQFRLVDQKRGPSPESRAIIVQARTLEICAQLGFDDVLTAGQIVRSVSIYRRGSVRDRLVFDDVGKSLSAYPFILSLPQDRHEQILLRHLHSLGVSPEWEQKLEVLEASDRASTATINGSREQFYSC